jgi:hypothetical protein
MKVAVSRFQASFPIGTERYSSGGLSYDVTIYQRGSSYHAAWYCRKCLSRTVTVDYPNQVATKRAAEADIDNHHLNGHTGRVAGG